MQSLIKAEIYKLFRFRLNVLLLFKICKLDNTVVLFIIV